MSLYLQAETTVSNLVIDYIEVSLTNGKIVSLNWDWSFIDRDENGFSAEYKGVCFNEDRADGRIKELQNMQITDIGLYTETQAPATIQITEMVFEEDGAVLSVETLPYQTTRRCTDG